MTVRRRAALSGDPDSVSSVSGVVVPMVDKAHSIGSGMPEKAELVLGFVPLLDAAPCCGRCCAPASGWTILTLGVDRFCDGRVFDPERFDAYVAGFDIGKPANHGQADGSARSSPAREAAS